ncbi:metallophosphoesterase family protein [Ilumatobacter coccineus]|uniref:Calcineurin-like phosphoesterase domain-containing protein n=1 Tax=Ilumatobacter coccineus (strain NBRC 103263 / KCTC 29153 / YM16-304) TaxID=1313172 RepID=A0A6C7EHK4_ILUCY|nr:metallophosphoesterase [Ilumatobacter coccineus]BAN04038.1 hypothetical protein YM304_37240 [Ilumatobacter coccineus YM16-304]
MTSESPSPSRPIDVTTVTDTEAVVHATRPDGTVEVHRFDDLEPAATTALTIDTADGPRSVDVTTLQRPPGELLCRFATVNDVHFGELAAGQIDDLPDGPVRRPEPGAEPYPEVMNRCAVTEMLAVDPAAVIVKGDLSLDGAPEEWEAFERCYRDPIGDRLHVVRGNHDAYRGQNEYAGDQRIDLPGITVALLDTTIPLATTGAISPDQGDWLDAVAHDADRPVIAMGHHQQWIPDPDDPESGTRRNPEYFGLHPDASDLLDNVCARRANLIAYSAGHTHRHRVRRMCASRVPSIEVGCTKDFPGTWAEYRVFEGGVMQVVHRISGDEALRWSESCRGLYADFGIDYEQYAMGALHDRCFVIDHR